MIAVPSGGPKMPGREGEDPVSVGFRWAGLSGAGAIGSTGVINEGNSLPLQRVREPLGMMGAIAGIPEKTMSQSCLATLEGIRKKIGEQTVAFDTTLYPENFLKPRSD